MNIHVLCQPDNRDTDKKKHARQLAVSPKEDSDKTALFSFGLTIGQVLGVDLF
jgi:hypothetical protein